MRADEASDVMVAGSVGRLGDGGGGEYSAINPPIANSTEGAPTIRGAIGAGARSAHASALGSTGLAEDAIAASVLLPRLGEIPLPATAPRPPTPPPAMLSIATGGRGGEVKK